MANEIDYNPCKYKGNGTTLNFSFNWNFIENNDIIVKIENSLGTQTTLTFNTDYTIDVADSGGEVICKVAPEDDEYIIISRNTSNLQKTRYSTSVGFQGADIEKSFDRYSCNLQEMNKNIENFKSEFTDEIEDKIENFEVEVNDKIELVREASEKIINLEYSIARCETYAASASASAETCTNTMEEINAKAQEVEGLVESAEAKIESVKYTKYSVNSGAVDEDGNPAYLISYTEEVEIPATEETTDSTSDTATDEDTTSTSEEPTTETHTYLKLLAGTVYTDSEKTHTVAEDIIIEITDKNTTDVTYNVFVEHVDGQDVLTIKENLVEVANIGTTPVVAEGEETAEDNYLLIPQEPLQAYWVNTSATKTPTSAVNIGFYNGGG